MSEEKKEKERYYQVHIRLTEEDRAVVAGIADKLSPGTPPARASLVHH